MVAKVANELEVERGVRKTDIKIKNNPGFQTNIILDKETGIITITTENINNINYGDTVVWNFILLLGLILCNFWINWATFYSNIWSHCKSSRMLTKLRMLISRHQCDEI